VTGPVAAIFSSVQIVAVEIAVDPGSCLRYLTPKKWRPVKRSSSSDKDSSFWQNLYVSPNRCREC